MIIGTLRMLPLPKRRTEVLELLRRVQEPVRSQPGCCEFRIYEEPGRERAVVLFERWAPQAALEEHIRSEDYRLILGALELSSQVPEVSFDHVSEAEGIELIERVRR